MAILDYVAAYQTLVAVLYIYVGFRVAHRDVQGEGRTALALFQVWWFGLGAASLIGALQILLFRLDALPVPLYSGFAQVNLLLIVGALWGLLYYLWYLYTGSSRALIPLTVVYGVFYAGLSAWVASFGTPEAIVAGRWALDVRPGIEPSPALTMVLLVGLIGPQIAAAFAYFRLYFVAQGPTQKYRIGLVSAGILIWFGIALVASLVSAATGSQFTQTDAWQVASRIISLGAVFAIFSAYHPPQWVQRRYGVEAS